MEQVQHILADQIIDPVVPMRSDMDREKIDDLASSIKSEGLINPLTVRPVHNPKDCPPGTPALHEMSHSSLPCIKYEIVAGHRRFKACLMAGVIKIPCVIREMTDQEVYSLRAHENLFRDDVDPVDEAMYLARIIGEDESKIPEVAKKLNRTVQWVEDRLEIMTYPDYLIAGIKQGKVKLGVAKWLGAIQDDVYRKMFCEQAINHGLAVWQAETYYRQWEGGVFKNSTEIIPPVDDSLRPEPQKLRTKCARCALLAEEPNLKNVFIHIECPPESALSPIA